MVGVWKEAILYGEHTVTCTIQEGYTMSFVMFSKMFHSLSIPKTGEVIRTMGFDGVDLTVRPEGHVLPENVAGSCPKR